MEVIPLGAAGTVTGSRFLVLAGGRRLLVDCGLFQGVKVLRLRNWRLFPFEPASLSAVVLTHAHLDHAGALPILVREGFRGSVLVTPATRDLLPILLRDAGRLQEEDAAHAARKGYSRHAEPRPLFTEAEAAAVEERLEVVPFQEDRDVDGISLRFRRAGHLLGAASALLREPDGDSVLFSGDLGRPGDILLPGPESREPADAVVMESTYGDRSHPASDPLDSLASIVRETVQRGGVVLVPTFAVGRAQALALALHRLAQEGRIPRVPMFLNSPMALSAGEVHLRHGGELRVPVGELTRALEAVSPVASVQESRELNERRGPMVILAGAGMLTGGRILHHLLAFGTDARNTLLLSGFQAEGTRGRELLGGGRTIRIHGRPVELRCRIEAPALFSGHADRDELLAWLASGPPPPRGVGLVHGEPAASDHFRRRVESELVWPVEVAEEGRPLWTPAVSGTPAPAPAAG